MIDDADAEPAGSLQVAISICELGGEASTALSMRLVHNLADGGAAGVDGGGRGAEAFFHADLLDAQLMAEDGEGACRLSWTSSSLAGERSS